MLALVLATTAGILAERQIEQDIGQELEYLAQHMSNNLDQGMFERYREIQIIAQLKPLRDPQTPIDEQQALLEKLQVTYPNYSWIGFTDAQGNVRVSTRNLLQGESVAKRPWFIQGRQNPFLGDVHEAVLLAKLLPRTSNEPLRFVDIATPVRTQQGNFLGVLGAHMSWQWAKEVKESLLGSPRSEGKEIFVLTQKGEVLLGPTNWEKKTLSLRSIELSQSGQNGYHIERWPDGKIYLTGYMQSTGYRDYPGLGWIVLVRQDINNAFVPARHLRQQIMIEGALFGLIFAALGWLLADQVSKPLLTIASAADQIRRGKKDVKIPVLAGKDETAQLSQTLNQLIDALMSREVDLSNTNQRLLAQLALSKRMSQSLHRSEEQMRQVVDNIQDALILKSAETGKVIYFNPGYVQLHQCPVEELRNDPTAWIRLIHPDDRDRITQKFQSQLGAQKFVDDEYRLMMADGTSRWVWDRSFPIRDETGKIYRYVVVKRDITDRKYSEEIFKTLTERTAPVVGEDFFSTLVQYLSEALGVEYVLIAEQVDDTFQTLAYWANGVLQPNFGYPIQNTPCKQVLDKDSYYQAVGITQLFPNNLWLANERIEGYYGLALMDRTGQTMGHLCIFSRRKLDEQSRYAAILQIFATRAATEIERQRFQEQLKYDALHDGLTGLPNRNLLAERLDLAIKRAQQQQTFQYAVLFIDLDRFKVINDSLGHLLGDQLLIQVAQRLKQIASPIDLVARFGGDEFVLLLEEIDNSQAAIRIADRILATLQAPMNVADHRVNTSASIGIVMGTADYSSSSELLRDADIAMYRAKENRRACYEVFNSAMHAQALRQLQLENALRQALDRQEFSLRYQPIVSLISGDLVGFEALVRWEHPVQGTISPGEFIPVAEETGLIVPLGKWVLEASCRQMVAWQAQFPAAASLKVSVNLSALQLREADLVQHICQTLETTGLAKHCLALEITESMLMQDIEETSRLLAQLRDQEIQISIDDFGTGFSSLNYLHRFPANNLKIDRSFVSHLFDSIKNQQIAETIVTLADQLGMNAIAEGIETSEQLEQLQLLNCELGQGYLFGAPLTVQAAADRIAQ